LIDFKNLKNFTPFENTNGKLTSFQKKESFAFEKHVHNPDLLNINFPQKEFSLKQKLLYSAFLFQFIKIPCEFYDYLIDIIW
jgi:hypothetical protein